MSATRTRKLPRSFYDRPTLLVCEELIGKFVVHRRPEILLSARIVEVEAYVGEDDPASHAAPGPTKRNALMYGRPGIAYIYFIYGMYHCLNFVTERRGFPSAILLRAAEPVEGVDFLGHQSGERVSSRLLSGPGKFCRNFVLTLAQNGMDLTGPVLYLEDRGEDPRSVERSPRIGIRKGTEMMWRFFDADSSAVSGKRNGAIGGKKIGVRRGREQGMSLSTRRKVEQI
jgi:DNA-3-methyladenine glycosylase